MAEKPKGPKKDDPEQSQRFVETAKALGSEKSDKAFEEAMKTVLASLPPRPVRPKVVTPYGEAMEKLVDVKLKRLARLEMAKKPKK